MELRLIFSFLLLHMISPTYGNPEYCPVGGEISQVFPVHTVHEILPAYRSREYCPVGGEGSQVIPVHRVQEISPAYGSRENCPVGGEIGQVIPVHELPIRNNTVHDYQFIKQLGSGGYGTAWLATRRDSIQEKYVIKRIKTELAGTDRSGLREIHFGHLFQRSPGDGREHVARFVDAFGSTDDMHIVSLYEGNSLFSIIYTLEELNGERVDILPTVWSSWLRTTSRGREFMRIIIYHLLSGLRYCHDVGVTHHDIKLANVVVCFRKDKGSCSTTEIHIGSNVKYIHLRIIDFGLSLDAYSIKNLYGPEIRFLQTFAYAAPETFEGLDVSQPTSMISKYDMWTVGNVILELVTGKFQLFRELTTPEGLKLYREMMEELNSEAKEHIIRMISHAEFCIFPPSLKAAYLRRFPHCFDEFAGFRWNVQRQDGYHIESSDFDLLQLIWRLLAFDPAARLTAHEAMHHTFFSILEDASDDE